MKFVYVFFSFLTLSCTPIITNSDYINWKAERKNFLYSDDGYLNLAGIFPISTGTYTMGSQENNDIKLPEVFPDKFAKIYVTDSSVLYEYYHDVYYRDSIKTKAMMINGYNSNEFFSWKNFRWFVHVDSGFKGIRLRDLKHPLLETDLKIDFFPYSKDYIVKGRFEPYEEEKTIQIFNFLGGSFNDTAPGKITFSIVLVIA